MQFTKMQGCGNDYIYVDGFTEKVPQEKKEAIVISLSDRHFGIGGDGVIFINPSNIADFEMEMYNADGSRAEMCGNGIRCVGKYVYDHGMTDRKNVTVESCGKIKYLKLTTEEVPDQRTGASRSLVTQVEVNMGEPELRPEQIPVMAEGDKVIAEPITVEGKTYLMTCVSMGNPHAVIFMEDVAGLKIEDLGPYFENHERFPKRINTEFVRVINKDTVEMRVWERGTGETLACGTGCCATVVACILNGLTKDEVTVKLLGGEILIRWDRSSNRVFMTGPAVTVFDGEADISRF